VLHQPLGRIDPQEAEQPLDLLVGPLQQVFVAHFGVVWPEQSRAVFDGSAHKESPVAGRLPQPHLGEHALLRPFLRVLTQSLALRQFLGREPVEVAPVGAAPPTVNGGDRPVPAVPYYVNDPGPWIHGTYFPHEPFVRERRLVPDKPLAGLGELFREKVLRGQAHKGVQVLVGISIPAPHRAFDPESQVLGVGQGVVEGARDGPVVRGVEIRPPPARGEKAPLTLAQHLRVGVQDLGQPPRP
jgi:hypothetical protein